VGKDRRRYFREAFVKKGQNFVLAVQSIVDVSKTPSSRDTSPAMW
jgi:hypothetical protein